MRIVSFKARASWAPVGLGIALLALLMAPTTGCVGGGVPSADAIAGVVEVTGEAQFQKEVLQASEVVLVDFFATWCGPCKRQAPILKELADEGISGLKIVKVDTDKNQAVAGKYKIRSIPTLMVFKEGKSVEQMVGLQTKGALKAATGKHL